MSVTERVTTYRERMRRKGYRPVQVWVPDAKVLADDIAAQGRRVAEADARDGTLGWLDAANEQLWQDAS